jgi:hypothetical protein
MKNREMKIEREMLSVRVESVERKKKSLRTSRRSFVRSLVVAVELKKKPNKGGSAKFLDYTSFL